MTELLGSLSTHSSVEGHSNCIWTLVVNIYQNKKALRLHYHEPVYYCNEGYENCGYFL